jgi:hypothetical protein
MRQDFVLRHEFVEFIPDELKEGTIYVSIRFATAAHLCCCGCGNKVVTPLRPTDWTLARTVHRKLEFPLPVSLLDKMQQGEMGHAMVPGRNCRRKGA